MTTCKACNKSLSNEYKYCPVCGAKVIAVRLSIPKLLQRAILVLTDLNLPFFRTLKGLFFNPRTVTIQYIEGLRKHITGPIQFALIILSIYGVFQYFFSDFLDIVWQKDFLSGFQEGISGAKDIEKTQMNNWFKWIKKHYQFVNFLIIPFLGWTNAKLFSSKNYNLAEHYVISFYAISFAGLLGIVTAVVVALINTESVTSFYVEFSYILNVAATMWVVQKSLEGSIFKSILSYILAFSSLVLLLLIGFSIAFI